LGISEYASNAFEQLNDMKVHGFPIRAMMGTKSVVALDDGIQFEVHPAGAANRGKVNKVVLKVTPDDLYNMEFWYIKGVKAKKSASFDGVDVEQVYNILKDYIVDGKPFKVEIAA
jgi:hypothetical protein